MAEVTESPQLSSLLTNKEGVVGKSHEPQETPQNHQTIQHPESKYSSRHEVAYNLQPEEEVKNDQKKDEHPTFD